MLRAIVVFVLVLAVAVVLGSTAHSLFVMDAWAKNQHVPDDLLMLADGNGEFAAAAGLELDGSAFGLGTRSQRYAAILEDGVVRQLMVEPDPLAVTVSSVAAVLDAL